jgi:hypothetical protein
MSTDESKKVVVKWMDAKIYPGVYSIEDALRCKMDTFESLGYLIEKNDRATVIAHEITDEGKYRDVLLIPSGSVISIQKLITSSSM